MSMTTTEMGGNTTSASTNGNNTNEDTCSPSVAAAGQADGDEKSHTFRKRRLSLSRHHIGPGKSDDAAASATATATMANASSSEKEVPPLPVVTTENGGNEAEPLNTNGHEEDDADKKAHTFRKRRLSLTLNAPFPEEENDELEDEDEETTGTPAGETEETRLPKRPRRASDASAASLGSSQTGNQRGGLKVRTLHAGEIVHQLSAGPPSPALVHGAGAAMGSSESPNNRPHVLYRLSRPPSSTTLLSLPLLQDHNQDFQDIASPQPKWKKRITRKHDEDERKLPFPRDVVGTYSCHGVEPVYDSDYDHCLDEDEVDDEELLRGPDSWTEDISGDSDTKFPTPNVGKPHFTGATMLRTKEPKPSTAAKINQDRGGVAFPYGNCARTALFAAYDGE
jgi:hypothetical protein